jgi:transposase-like protein
MGQFSAEKPVLPGSVLSGNQHAAVKLMRKLLKKQGFTSDVLVTDKLRSYGAAKSEIGLSARHDQDLRANNRAGNSH